ncbi:unnamed protein product, partial [marine sediment metagenome]
LVAGAGNWGGWDFDGIIYPARYESVIAVGATDQQDTRASFSSTGSTLELMAPGVGILSTSRGGGYSGGSGTSFAAPHVTGIAALLIASGVTSNVEVRQTLQSMAEDLGPSGWDSWYGYGLAKGAETNVETGEEVPEATDNSTGEEVPGATDNSTGEEVPGATDNSTGEEVPEATDENIEADSNNELSDTIPPTTGIELSGLQGNKGWYRSDVTVELTALDNAGGSGVAETQYSLDGGQTWQSYHEPFDITQEGINTVQARSLDNAGNVEGLPASREVKSD